MTQPMQLTKTGEYAKSWTLLKRCLMYFRPYTKRVVFAIVCMGGAALATAGTAFLVKPALDDIFINKNREALMAIPLIFLGLMTFKCVADYLESYFMKVSALHVLEDLRNDLYNKMIHLPVRFYEDNQQGMLISRVITDVMMIRASLPALVTIVRQVLTAIALIFVVFYRDWYLAFWAVLVLPLAFYPFFYFSKKLRKYGRRNQAKLGDISSVLHEIFGGIRVVKAFATEKEEVQRFDKENRRLVKVAEKQVIASELSSRIMEMVGALGMSLVIWYGGFQVIEGMSTPGTFFSFMTGLIMLYEPIKKLNRSNADVQKALAGAERVFEVIDAPHIIVEKDGCEPFTPPFKELHFDNITFAYEDLEHPALDAVDLRIKAGEKVALVGPSGSGKTTMVNMVPRFYEPQKGRILLNGRDLKDYTLDSLRRNIGMVSQDAFLFNVSVAENIAYGQEHVNMEAVKQAARAAYAHDFVQALPRGYDTIIGERGVKLSGGQKQRLTIARALLKNPPLLILDEATSALDTESERIVQLALENLMQNRTSIVIAHRLSTVLGADRIVVMENGRIVDSGPHATVVETCPLYAKLYAMQFDDSAGRGCVADTEEYV